MKLTVLGLSLLAVAAMLPPDEGVSYVVSLDSSTYD